MLPLAVVWTDPVSSLREEPNRGSSFFLSNTGQSRKSYYIFGMSFSKDTLGPRVRRVAEQLGYTAIGGGWVGKYKEDLFAKPTVIGQGWLPTVGRRVADKLTQKYTAFGSMQDMLDAKGDYRPTIMPYGSAAQRADMKLLRDLYNFYQERRGDPRRAFPEMLSKGGK